MWGPVRDVQQDVAAVSLRPPFLGVGHLPVDGDDLESTLFEDAVDGACTFAQYYQWYLLSYKSYRYHVSCIVTLDVFQK